MSHHKIRLKYNTLEELLPTAEQKSFDMQQVIRNKSKEKFYCTTRAETIFEFPLTIEMKNDQKALKNRLPITV